MLKNVTCEKSYIMSITNASTYLQNTVSTCQDEVIGLFMAHVSHKGEVARGLTNDKKVHMTRG